MSLYLLINFLIILFPFLFSFEKRINFVSKFSKVFFAILSVGGLFALWDVFAAAREHWYFNPLHVGQINLLTLPIEEWLFFVTVPYACLFVFESVNYFFKDKKFFSARLVKKASVLVALLFFFLAFMFVQKEYTSLAFFASGVCSLILAFYSDLFSRKNYWIYFLLTFGLFLIFNFILTSIPIITHNPQMILGIRAGTIPLEDFFFNYSMLSLLVFVFEKGVRKKIN